jgi:hypothetical protein
MPRRPPSSRLQHQHCTTAFSSGEFLLIGEEPKKDHITQIRFSHEPASKPPVGFTLGEVAAGAAE